MPGAVLGIESSCDETAAAVIDEAGTVLAEAVLSQQAEHARFGGVVPEIAARAHLRHLPGLVGQVMTEAGLGFAALGGVAATVGAISQEPAVPVKKSVMPDHIVCLEDGKKLKMLKRHLRTAYGLTPEQYREKWNLPADYPMVAPNYAKKRSSLARQIGLGTGGRRR